MRPRREETDPRLRSLLQKAVRRADLETVRKVFHLLAARGPRERSWLRQRVKVIAFEECWPIAASLALDRTPGSKLRALLRIARATKQKDAAGLGALAYALSKRDRTVLAEERALDRPVRVVAEALSRPEAFWAWVTTEPMNEASASFVEAARGAGSVGWPWDQACVYAAAFLAHNQSPPPVVEAPADAAVTAEVWTALDRHTPEGKRAFAQVGEAMGVPRSQIEWSSFYFESARTNSLAETPWWQRERRWRLSKVGLSEREAESLWHQLRPRVAERLAEEARRVAQIVSTSVAGQEDQASLFGGSE